MKAAIVGCGGLGQVHAGAYAAMADVQLVGVCDIIPERADRLAEKLGTTAYYSMADMLEKSGCEVVSVTVPSDLHKELTLQAASAGRHVICEKPIALNMEDAAEMIRVCEENGVRLFVGHVVRFFPEYVQMKNKVSEGALGRIGVAHGKRVGGHPGDVRDWYRDEARSGGVVADLMIHDIDFMRWALGEVKTVYSTRRSEHEFDYALATLIFESGAAANLEAYWGYPGHFTTAAEIAGSKGIVKSDSSKTKALQIRKSVEGGGAGAAGFVEVPQSPAYQTPYEKELRHFVDCIRERKEPVVTARDAACALEIALAINESARSGQAVVLSGSRKEGAAHA